MSGPMKPIPHPPGTLWRCKIEVDGQETYVEIYVKRDNLIVQIGQKLVSYDKSVLLKENLMTIGEDAIRKYEAYLHPKPEEDKNINEVSENPGVDKTE